MRRFHRSLVPLLLCLIAVSGCAVYWGVARPETDAYDGESRDNEELAIIEQGIGCWSCVHSIRSLGAREPVYSVPDGQFAFHYPKVIRLLPGEYAISLKYRGRKSSPAYATSEVNLEAGRTYYVKGDACVGGLFCWSMPSNTSFVWMENDSGEVIFGRKP